MDNPHDGLGGPETPPMPSEDELLAMMEQSEQDVAAGRTVPVEDVLAELDEIAVRIETRRRTSRR